MTAAARPSAVAPVRAPRRRQPGLCKRLKATERCPRCAKSDWIETTEGARRCACGRGQILSVMDRLKALRVKE
jgi:hypothetical protein